LGVGRWVVMPRNQRIVTSLSAHKGPIVVPQMTFLTLQCFG
jgi:hypothetical protein